MPASKYTLLPKVGRGLVTYYSVHSLGEFADAFQQYFNILDGGNSWTARPGDSTVATGVADTPVRALHFFNFVVDTAGGMDTILLSAQGTKVLRLDTGATLFSASSPYEFCFETFRNRCFIAGANNTPKIFDGTSTYDWGANGPLTDMTYEPFNVTDSDTKVWVGTANVTKGSTTVNKASGSNYTTGATWVGKTTLLDGVEYTIASVSSTTQLLLTEQYKGDTASGVSQTVQYGAFGWDKQPPMYAMAYYNPTTGHITNRGPVLRISEQDTHNVRVALGNIVTDAALNTAGYTKIVIFRTADNGGELFPLKLTTADGYLNNTGGPLTYNDEADQDELGLILGLKHAPTTNNKPPTGLRFIASHRGRFFGVDGTTPYRLRFSGDSGDTELGRPEECWPEENFRDLPAPITGMHVVGDTLLITTDEFVYYLIGSSALDYDYRKLSTLGVGVRHWAIDEHPGDSSTESASAIYIGKDRCLWRHFPGGRIENIGDPIQDLLDAAPIDHSRPFFVKVVRIQRYRFLILGIINAGKTAYTARFYDFTSQKWLDQGYSSGASYFCVGAGLDYDNGHKFRALIGASGAANYFALLEAANTSGAIKTLPIDFGDRNAKKSLDTVTVYVNDRSLNFTLTVELDESASELTLQKNTTVNTPRDRGPGVIQFDSKIDGASSATLPNQWHAAAFKLSLPAGGRAYRMDMFYLPVTTHDMGETN